MRGATRCSTRSPGLLVELHLASCFWGDCNLSNVLYRFDAEAIDTIMVDAETAELYPGSLSDGRRGEDIEIMVENVAGGMADIAAEAGVALDDADLDARRGHRRAVREPLGGARTRGDRRRRRAVPDHGADRATQPSSASTWRRSTSSRPRGPRTELVIKVRVGGRSFHANRLKTLTGVDALENQARAILSDVHYYSARHGEAPGSDKAVLAIQWRVREFEPLLAQLAALEGVSDPIQAYCDVLHHRYMLASGLRRDISTQETIVDWVARGRPGYPLTPPTPS